MRVFPRTESKFQVSQVRSFFAFVELLVKDRVLVDLCVEQEIRYYFYYKDKQLLEKMTQQKHGEQKPTKESGEQDLKEEKKVERKFENLSVNRPELIKI